MRRLLFGIGLLGFVVSGVTARAAMVQDLWGANGANGEWNLYSSGSGSAPGAGIMEYIYGTGHFTLVDNASVWTGAGTVTLDAVYAAAGQNLYTTGIKGAPPQSSLLVSGSGVNYGVAPSRVGTVANIDPAIQPFLFLDQANGNNAYSAAAYSSGGSQRMVAFKVSGYMSDPGAADNNYVAFVGGEHYVVAFEDGTDNDFNDLVVEVAGAAPVAVPEPSSLVAAALLIGFPFGASIRRVLRK